MEHYDIAPTLQSQKLEESPNPKKVQSQGATKKSKRRKETGINWLDDPYTAIKGEESLWVAVITQAMMDALSNSRNAEIQYFKTEATRWLTENNKDFIEVCLLANMDPDYVRKKAKKVIASPIAWRAAPGTGKRYLERKNKKNKPQQATTHEERAVIIVGPW